MSVDAPGGGKEEKAGGWEKLEGHATRSRSIVSWNKPGVRKRATSLHMSKAQKMVPLIIKPNGTYKKGGTRKEG